MTNDIHWEFDLPSALLRCRSITARVNVSCPQLGVHDLGVNLSKVAGALFATEWSEENTAESSTKSASAASWPMGVADAYVRGDDLVATYGRLPNSHYAPQLYWRIEQGLRDLAAPSAQHPANCGLSLLVSLQTDLLNSHPRIRVTTRLAADEVIRADVPGLACVLWRLAGSDVSYAEVVSESDFRDVSLESAANGQSAAHWDLFAEFLEKGVIRRARIDGVFLPRDDDLDAARDFCLKTRGRPLPLTT